MLASSARTDAKPRFRSGRPLRYAVDEREIRPSQAVRVPRGAVGARVHKDLLDRGEPESRRTAELVPLARRVRRPRRMRFRRRVLDQDEDQVVAAPAPGSVQEALERQTRARRLRG